MNSSETLRVSPLARSIAVPGLPRVFRALALAKLKGLKFGTMVIVEGGERLVFKGESSALSLEATATVHDARVYSLLALRGSIGAGEAFMLGYWTCNDLTVMIRLFLLNREVLEGVDSGSSRFMGAVLKLYHRLRENTRGGSVKNIADHYDLGNQFFSAMLDATMMYSCAYFANPSMTLEEASIAKVRRIADKLALKPSDRVMEIGTGWGFFSTYIAREYGCHVTTTTISERQFEVASRRVQEMGLQDRVEVIRRDYRDLEGRFDKLVSIEMIEAVGHAYYDEFFGVCSRLLQPDGEMLLQAIIIDDRVYHEALRSVDFIQRYIFPGSCIPSIAAMVQSVAASTDMQLFQLEDITRHYPPTLATWRTNLLSHREALRQKGYDDVFQRMMEFYLCYCEGGFLEGAIGDVQMHFKKPWARRQLS